MTKIVAFAGSNSATSINRQLAGFTASLVVDAEVTNLDLNDFEVPIYSPEREQSGGVPNSIREFMGIIEGADGLVISMAEHNGSYSAAIKNIIDWCSRVSRNVFAGKTTFLMATSPGGRGGKGVLEASRGLFPRFGADVVATFSLPFFGRNFNPTDGVTDPELRSAFETQLSLFADKFI